MLYGVAMLIKYAEVQAFAPLHKMIINLQL